MARLAIAVLVLTVLAGCKSWSDLETQCKRYGFAPGTEAFSKCVQDEYNAHYQRTRTRP